MKQIIGTALLGSVLILAAGCSSDDGGGNSPSKSLASSLMESGALELPSHESRGQKLFSLPEGTYGLKALSSKRVTNEENVDYKAVHVLAKAGEFDSDKDTTRVQTDWKQLTQKASSGEYVYSYLEFNVPLTISTTDGAFATARNIYYYNKVRSDNKGKLFWAADTGNIDRREDGVHYLNVFNLGQQDNNVYTHNFNYSNVEARGVIFTESEGTLEFVIEHTTTSASGETSTRNVRLTYEKI